MRPDIFFSMNQQFEESVLRGGDWVMWGDETFLEGGSRGEVLGILGFVFNCVSCTFVS